MKTASRGGSSAWAIAALLVLGGCTTLLGLDQEYHLVGSGGAGGRSTGGAAGTGGEPATTSVASSASSGGTGGEPACSIVHVGKKGTCEYLPNHLCGCDSPKEKCAVTDQASGESSCVPISVQAKPAWSACQTDADCAKNTWCEHVNHVCEPLCQTSDDCDPSAQCIPVLQDGTTMSVPGLLVCTSHCDPINPVPPCGDGLTCRYNFAVKDFECARTNGEKEGSACVSLVDCDPKLLCVGQDPTYTCQKWCTPADGLTHPSCPGGRPYCKAFNPTITRDGVTYGICSP